ncbi:dATP/dGTP diphosphohydrolase domain-containing protein [Brevibacillus brevis]|uniref:dATP/dGTP diphosphohydrolase domain-containing protein n=1 Tax=Brevibacillus brevis TaxID=1393 RepID=UPI00165E3800|nr:dATP/dGTP diphosphohydrolase domain-containing protein [Brevibacillus brevis]
MMPAGIRDDGQHKTFGTGAKRDRALGKGRYDLLSPIAMRRIAQRSELGEIKYGDGRNWEKGMPISEFMDSALRHIFQYMAGDTQEDHLAAAAWNLNCAMHMEETMPKMQNIPARIVLYEQPETSSSEKIQS